MEPDPKYPHYHLPYHGLPSEIRMKIWRYVYDKAIVMNSFEPNATSCPTFSPSIHPELLRLNKQIHQEILETWRTSLYLYADHGNGIREDPFSVYELPFQPPFRFKGFVVRCVVGFDEQISMKGALSLILDFKIESLVLMYGNTRLLLEKDCTEAWSSCVDEFYTPGLIKDMVQYLLDGSIKSLVLHITPHEDYTRPEVLAKWKAFYHLDKLSELDAANLKFVVGPITLPPLPVARRWCRHLGCPRVWHDSAGLAGLTITRAEL